jgi:hypothetical protein
MKFEISPLIFNNSLLNSKIEKVLVFDHTKEAPPTIMSEEEFFYEFQYKFEITDSLTNLSFIKNYNKAIKNTFGRGCIFETEKELHACVSFSVMRYIHIEDDKNGFCEKNVYELIYGNLSTFLDYFFSESKEKEAKLYFTFPYLGISAIYNRNETTKEEVLQNLAKFEYNINQYLEEFPHFSLYCNLFEKSFGCYRTPLCGTYSVISNKPKILFHEPSVNVHNDLFDGLNFFVLSLSQFLENNFLILQKEPHGEWYIWYSEKNSKGLVSLINKIQESFQEIPNFVNFLKKIYSIEVVPYNLEKDMVPISIEKVLNELNSATQEMKNEDYIL